MRIRYARMLLLCLGVASLASASARAAPRAAPPERAQLVGAWRLLGIEYRGPGGALEDPFYHRGSGGLLIYDASGVMSVQIAGAARPAVAVTAARPAAALTVVPDGYYAYYGTWELDAGRSMVVHHVDRALYSGEEGDSYSQEVQVTEGRLVMTNRHREADGEYVRTKTWERVAAPPRQVTRGGHPDQNL